MISVTLTCHVDGQRRLFRERIASLGSVAVEAHNHSMGAPEHSYETLTESLLRLEDSARLEFAGVERDGKGEVRAS